MEQRLSRTHPQDGTKSLSFQAFKQSIPPRPKRSSLVTPSITHPLEMPLRRRTVLKSCAAWRLLHYTWNVELSQQRPKRAKNKMHHDCVYVKYVKYVALQYAKKRSASVFSPSLRIDIPYRSTTLTCTGPAANRDCQRQATVRIC